MGEGQSGIVLFVALMLLLILSLIGVTVARMQTVEERMARNENSGQLANQAAEAALRNAEGILGNAPPVATFAGNTLGYYTLSPTTGSLVPSLNWAIPANSIQYLGPSLSLVPLAVRKPLMVMELAGYGTVPGDTLSVPLPVYRITVQALNADGTPSVILQSVYR